MTKREQKISKCNQEYFHHAAKLQLRFNELMVIIQRELREKLRPTENRGVLQMFTSFFMNDSLDDGVHAILKDVSFLKRLKCELKHYEICVRIFEETCIHTVLDIQKEAFDKNIDLLLEQDFNRGPIRENIHKQVPGRLLD